jgi:hypothetical protein
MAIALQLQLFYWNLFRVSVKTQKNPNQKSQRLRDPIFIEWMPPKSINNPEGLLITEYIHPDKAPRIQLASATGGLIPKNT